jgi:kynureninase
VQSIEPSPFRDRFYFPRDEKRGREKIYLDGNSLGPMLRSVPEHMNSVIQSQWAEQLIGGWNAGWIELPTRLGDLIGQIIGAKPGETLVADSTSVNLYKLAMAALSERPERNQVLTDNSNFPSDRYVLGNLNHAHDQRIELRTIPWRYGDSTSFLDVLEKSITPRTALISLSHVDYRSGYAFDIPAITELAHRHGVRVLWDLSHSVGALPIDLAACQADLAVGCTYKFLNGGPGAPAFLYVRQDLQKLLANPIAGWLSAANPFAFGDTFEPSNSIRRFWVGTPPILSMAAIGPGLKLTLEAGLVWIRERSLQLTTYFIEQSAIRLAKLNYQIITPTEPARRGSHIALAHPEAWRITQALIDRYNIIPDFRPPNIIRLGIAPLYTSAAELDQTVDALEGIIRSLVFLNYDETRSGVT